MYWQLMTLSRGGKSMYEILAKEFPSINISDYIVALSMRTFGNISEKTVSEQIYAHSKFIIVDDTVSIIGSANVNDRSFAGDRDSELATVVEDRAKVKIKMDGKDFLAARFSFSLRKFLY